MSDTQKRDGKKPWEPGFVDEEFSQKQQFRKERGVNPAHFTNSEPKQKEE